MEDYIVSTSVIMKHFQKRKKERQSRTKAGNYSYLITLLHAEEREKYPGDRLLQVFFLLLNKN